MPVIGEDGEIEFVRTETDLAVDAAFVNLFGPEPEEPDIDIG